MGYNVKLRGLKTGSIYERRDVDASSWNVAIERFKRAYDFGEPVVELAITTDQGEAEICHK
jgi:hypothetical protein